MENLNAGANQANQVPPQLVQVPAKVYGAKYQSKNEVYQFLAQENDVYLPPKGKCSFVVLPYR